MLRSGIDHVATVRCSIQVPVGPLTGLAGDGSERDCPCHVDRSGLAWQGQLCWTAA